MVVVVDGSEVDDVEIEVGMDDMEIATVVVHEPVELEN